MNLLIDNVVEVNGEEKIDICMDEKGLDIVTTHEFNCFKTSLHNFNYIFL